MKLHYFSSGPRERVFDAILDAGHEIACVYVTDPGTMAEGDADNRTR